MRAVARPARPDCIFCLSRETVIQWKGTVPLWLECMTLYGLFFNSFIFPFAVRTKWLNITRNWKGWPEDRPLCSKLETSTPLYFSNYMFLIQYCSLVVIVPFHPPISGLCCLFDARVDHKRRCCVGCQLVLRECHSSSLFFFLGLTTFIEFIYLNVCIISPKGK